MSAVSKLECAHITSPSHKNPIVSSHLLTHRPRKYPDTMRTLLLSLLLLATATAAAGSVQPNARKALVGGWTPIKDTNDAHVLEIANYAVSEHNKAANSNLAFINLVRGETQTVSGVNYRLVVKVKSGGGAAAYYKAVVWEKAWLNFRELTSFEPVKV